MKTKYKEYDSVEEQLFDTGSKLIDTMERIEKLEQMLGKAVAAINELLKDEPECKMCIWEKQCAKGAEKKCMEAAEWKFTAAAYRLIREE